jgi:TolB-like protein/DNA-binding winged helix-turn-helix (wHTH) protein/Tfp pilus assembly protein PilF
MPQTTDTDNQAPGPFRLGDWTVEPSLNRLTRGDTSVQLEPKAMDVLVFLAQHAGEVLSREAIIDAVWAEDFVGEGVLRRAITVLRDALGDDARNPSYIETISKRGYRLIAEVMPAEPVTAPSGRQARGLRPRWTHALAIGIAAVIALLVILPPEGIWQRITGVDQEQPIRSIVVLPLTNLAEEPGQEYFADAMTEELITELARIGGFDKVISSTSSIRYRDTDKAPPEIGRELGVDVILEGSVLHTGGHVRINAQLIHAPTDSHLWAESYHRKIVDIIALQREIARTIASEIRIELTAEDKERLAGGQPVDPEAYKAYLMGRYHVSKLRGRGFARAREHYERATEIDPEYAPAYAALARSYQWLAIWKVLPPTAMETAKRYTREALARDDTLSEAHVANAILIAMWDRDPARAEAHYRRAIELEPSSSQAHSAYSNYLGGILRRSDEAVDAARRASELDPLNLASRMSLSIALYAAGRYDEAIELTQETLEMEPGQPAALYGLFVFHAVKGNHQKAIEALKAYGGASWPPSAEQQEVIQEALSTLGWAGLMESFARYRESQTVPDYNRAYRVAVFYALAGRHEEALHWLDTAYEARDFNLSMVNGDPVFDPLRSDPGFQDLLRRMNFPVD